MTGLMAALRRWSVGFVLVLVLVTVVAKGWSIVAGSFPTWFTKDIQLRPRVAGPGMKAAIIGTVDHHDDGHGDRGPTRNRRRHLPQRIRHAPTCSPAYSDS